MGVNGAPEGEAVVGVGIDLGATSLRAACAIQSDVRMLTWEDGSETTPAAIAMIGDKVLLGQRALEQTRNHVHDVVIEPLGLKGATFLGGVRHPVEEILGWWFAEVSARARSLMGPGRQRFVVCVPFEQRERLAPIVAAAASLAGAELLNTVQSTTAAAVCHGWSKGLGETELLVTDAGARKVESAVIRLRSDRVSVLGRAGESCGGRFLDERLAEACIHALVPGLDPRRLDSAKRDDVITRCEQARLELSRAETAHVQVSFLGDDAAWRVTRQELERVAAPLRAGVTATCERVIAESGLDPARLGAVIVIGAMGEMPLVLNAVRDATGREPEVSVGSGLASRGAALLATVMSRLSLPVPPRETQSVSPQPLTSRSAPPPPLPSTRPSPGCVPQTPSAIHVAHRDTA
ncbi:MAG TPA: Hsp70 family protein, partial [Polyangiaceae bacterium]|nr:Hsp70 family protein [Polyangiaceae bacterium]